MTWVPTVFLVECDGLFIFFLFLFLSPVTKEESLKRLPEVVDDQEVEALGEGNF